MRYQTFHDCNKASFNFLDASKVIILVNNVQDLQGVLVLLIQLPSYFFQLARYLQ